jgi:hypothetical protein
MPVMKADGTFVLTVDEMIEYQRKMDASRGATSERLVAKKSADVSAAVEEQREVRSVEERDSKRWTTPKVMSLSIKLNKLQAGALRRLTTNGTKMLAADLAMDVNINPKGIGATMNAVETRAESIHMPSPFTRDEDAARMTTFEITADFKAAAAEAGFI